MLVGTWRERVRSVLLIAISDTSTGRRILQIYICIYQLLSHCISQFFVWKTRLEKCNSATPIKRLHSVTVVVVIDRMEPMAVVDVE
jgi:hypothetical protein